MGAWGTAIFSDDTASDVKGEYTDLVGDGHSSEEATRLLEKRYRSTIRDRDDGPVFWLALAVTQHKLGRLEERVKTKALEIIDGGVDLQRWKGDAKQQKKRAEVLQKTREILLSAQGPAKRVAKRYINDNRWPKGQIVAYRLLSGSFIALRVIGHHEDRGGKSAVVEALEWSGTDLPDARDLKRAATLRWRSEDTQFIVGALSEREYPADRVHVMSFRLRPSQKPGGYYVSLWRNLDEDLRRMFGVG